MSTVIEQKQTVVNEIAEKLSNSESVILVDYRGLNVAQSTELRRQLREADVEFKVYKNTMTRRATEETNFTGIDEFLVGPTAIATSRTDAVAAAKVLHNFSKENKELEIKTGIIQGDVTAVEDIKQIAELPSYDGLVAMLLSVLQAPLRNFALASKAVADQKEENGEES
ncbi:large subunit ribosomal protein L10 [Geomicrobium halophilum]|uniref:Large ribosomal subunit protein uL10 n=1 Tax=Geomicrobium halophilum TaxID=549000 RepID=A0A841Q1A2_9BACL|nr:50S ribosomal protein L10 [Geomicrobium halophilum]MBB6451445.1 large subunit ribosomal protein L10 [Geomicrobium halophilum]